LEALKLQPREEFFTANENRGFFKIKEGGKLHWVSWIPLGMKSMIILVHDLGEHVGRYHEWASLFYSNKIGVIGLDMRGHGRSSGRRGGPFFKEYLRDINRLLTYTQENYPFIPKVLYGHGMGGNLVIRYAMEYRPLVAGIVSASPWIKLNNVHSDAMVKFSKFGSNFLPFITLSNRLHAEDLTHDKSIVNEYISDPLVHKRISFKLFLDMTESGRYILQNRHKINTPLLLMHGSSDRITSYKATSDFINYTSDFTTFVSWKGAYHELHNEFEKMEIFQYILRWMERLPSIQQG
jgi:acylglycerol lipase